MALRSAPHHDELRHPEEVAHSTQAEEEAEAGGPRDVRLPLLTNCVTLPHSRPADQPPTTFPPRSAPRRPERAARWRPPDSPCLGAAAARSSPRRHPLRADRQLEDPSIAGDALKRAGHQLGMCAAGGVVVGNDGDPRAVQRLSVRDPPLSGTSRIRRRRQAEVRQCLRIPLALDDDLPLPPPREPPAAVQPPHC